MNSFELWVWALTKTEPFSAHYLTHLVRIVDKEDLEQVMQVYKLYIAELREFRDSYLLDLEKSQFVPVILSHLERLPPKVIEHFLLAHTISTQKAIGKLMTLLEHALNPKINSFAIEDLTAYRNRLTESYIEGRHGITDNEYNRMIGLLNAVIKTIK